MATPAAPGTSLSTGSDSAEPDLSLSTGSDSAEPDVSLSTGSDSAEPDLSLSTGSDSAEPDVSLSTGSDSAEPVVSLSTGHDAIFDVECVSCRADGHRKEAERYCRECRGNICSNCVRGHKNVRSFKLHQLMDNVRNVENIRAQHVADIQVKSTGYKGCISDLVVHTFTDYTISGMAMVSHDTLVVAEWSNCVIRLIDTTDNKIVSEFIPKNRPCDVTTCKDTIAATFPGANKIMFMKYAEGLVRDREISVNGRCCGIDWHDGKLYVIYDSQKKLEVMTPAGVIIQTFINSAQGGQLFKTPGYVTVNAVNRRIYVSGWGIGRVVVLDLAGNQTGVYEDKYMYPGQPQQLAVDRNGVMFLCDHGSSTVHLLSPDGEKVKILLTKQDGVAVPYAACYCENTERLYVGMSRCNTIKVYRISF